MGCSTNEGAQNTTLNNEKLLNCSEVDKIDNYYPLRCRYVISVLPYVSPNYFRYVSSGKRNAGHIIIVSAANEEITKELEQGYTYSISAILYGSQFLELKGAKVLSKKFNPKNFNASVLLLHFNFKKLSDEDYIVYLFDYGHKEKDRKTDKQFKIKIKDSFVKKAFNKLIYDAKIIRDKSRKKYGFVSNIAEDFYTADSATFTLRFVVNRNGKQVDYIELINIKRVTY